MGQPLQGGLKQSVKGAKVGIGLSELFDDLGKVGRRKESGIGLAKTRMSFAEASFLQMMQSGATGKVPSDVTFMEKVEVSLEGAAWFGGAPSEGAQNAVVAGQPDGQQASFALATHMEKNSLILQSLAQGE